MEIFVIGILLGFFFGLVVGVLMWFRNETLEQDIEIKELHNLSERIKILTVKNHLLELEELLAKKGKLLKQK